LLLFHPQAIMKAQLASPTFSPLYAALISVVNTKFPELGELLCHRVAAQFKRAYKRNDKPITIAAANFLAHLINQGVVHEVRAGGLRRVVLLMLLGTVAAIAYHGSQDGILTMSLEVFCCWER
jgi:hypothetical protein